MAAAGDGAAEAGRVAQIALDQLGVKARQVAPVAAGPHQKPQPVASRGQRPGDGRAHETGGPRDARLVHGTAIDRASRNREGPRQAGPRRGSSRKATTSWTNLDPPRSSGANGVMVPTWSMPG